MTRVVGRGVSPGIAVGRALVAVRDARQVRYRLASSGVDRERQRLRNARERTRRELEEISARVARTIGPAQAAIFAAQLLILDDPLLTRRADELVRSERINADWAVERAAAEVQELFARDGDAWLRERAGDLTDVTARLLRSLRPDRDPLVDLIRELDAPLILVADELPPSVAAQLDWSRVRGLVCDAGGPTHHTAILVRSLGVPAVVGLAGATSVIGPGQTVAIDGSAGEVAVEPSSAVLDSWHARAEVQQAEERALGALRDRPAETSDGVRLRLEANLEIADEVRRVKEVGAEGIGLYRSEFLLDAIDPEGVSEERQYETYRALLAAMHPLPVAIRTFDAPEDREARRASGRDRFGLRGIRAELQHDERLRTQLRALLRAAPAGELRILLPFVTSVDEVRAARQLIQATAKELGVPANVPVGAMIEVPAAALTVDQLALEVDFLSVGTNDLIQYTLAVDRTDERLAGYYAPGTPAVLRLLRGVAIASRRAKRPLSICGEMAADPVMVAVLVGLGFRSFSMATSAIPVIKQGIRSVDSKDAVQLARRALRASSADDVHALLAPVAAAMHKEH
ncbi:MAG TPA: phosphoenolpyruvate--protein phosphotransferase [Vicinamibacterales bacterium]|nr:phosphoenolpyruvate--protein phosphotransferase [Vicinamibacterales bacterium]